MKSFCWEEISRCWIYNLLVCCGDGDGDGGKRHLRKQGFLPYYVTGLLLKYYPNILFWLPIYPKMWMQTPINRKVIFFQNFTNFFTDLNYLGKVINLEYLTFTIHFQILQQCNGQWEVKSASWVQIPV